VSARPAAGGRRRLPHRRQLFHFPGLSLDAARHGGRRRQRDARPVRLRALHVDLLEQVRPERIGVAFDQSLRSETSFRNGIYPAYKANRESPPADLERQFALCREFCRHMGLAEFASAEYEADDIIGTLAARSRAAGLRNVLVTRDKDLSQLIRDGDVFWDYSGNARYHYHDIGPRFGAIPS
jgi:DNA polymerase-1